MINTALQPFKTKIQPSNLISAFQQFENQIQTLSLDCFDTLLWRKTATPLDVFYAAQQKPASQLVNLSANLRQSSENRARGISYVRHGKTEVTLADIYRTAYPDLDDAAIATLVAAELETENDVCYAFSPVVELMRYAGKRQKKMIIVSDTYLTEPQLRQLLASKLPNDVMSLISEIFCSSEHGVGKSFGLFSHVLQRLNQSANSILHIGDNEYADYASARQLKIPSLHLLHGDETVQHMRNMYANAACFMQPDIRHQRPLMNPFQGLLVLKNVSAEKPESILGYAAMGSVMFAFAQFLAAEIDALQQPGKRTNVFFLLRDGFLPSKACEALLGKKAGYNVRISRFVALAASFRNKNDVERYLGDTAFSKRFDDLCRQLLLPDEIAASIIEKAERSENPVLMFNHLICQDEVLEIIFSKSKSYRARFFCYLQRETKLVSGETVIFVDLGYSGTVQQKLTPLLQEEFNVTVEGRYLISLRTAGAQEHRLGLLDALECDERALSMLTNYIALFEQLCTENERSVIDYTEEGEPLFAEADISQQYAALTLVQDECVRFINDATNFLSLAGIQLSSQELKDIAMSGLCRLLFLPTKTEIDYLQQFQFDLNLGTKKILDLFDVEQGLTDLKRRGLFFMERNLKSMRTNYPIELRAASFDLAMSCMSLERFKGKVAVSDLSLRRETVKVLIISNNQSAQDELIALPTFDGYFALSVPVGTGEINVAVQFGLHYQWFEIESMHLIEVSALYSDKESEHTVLVDSCIHLRDVNKKAEGLYECVSLAGILAFVPSVNFGNKTKILRIIFRPIVRR